MGGGDGERLSLRPVFSLAGGRPAGAWPDDRLGFPAIPIFGQGVWNATAHASGTRRKVYYRVCVEDVVLTSEDIGRGDISNFNHTLYVTFRNFGN